MAEKKYIERSAAALPAPDARWMWFYNEASAYTSGWNDAISKVLSIPPADVKQVVHAEWLEEKSTFAFGNFIRRYCSKCRKPPCYDKETHKFVLSDYCPNCGAEMK